MSFAIPRNYEPPASPTNAQWVFQVTSKMFEANTVAALETAIDAWMATLQVSPLEHAILSVNYQSATKERALIVYGYFINVTDI